MVHAQCSTGEQRVGAVSWLIAHQGSYGEVTHLSQQLGTSRQTVYSWKGTGRQALEHALTPAPLASVDERTGRLERVILTLLVDGHASYRGLQRCLEEVVGEQVSLGKIAAVVEQAGRGHRRGLRAMRR